MSPKNKSYFTIEERMQIIHEYETSNLTGNEVAQKYGLRSGNIIACWRLRLQNSKKYCNFAAENKPIAIMSDPERQEKDQRIAELERKVHQLEMRNLALSTLIDIAEEQGIQIRKKSGAKQ